MSLNKIPSRNIFVILVFGGGVLLFIMLAIFPNYISYNSIVHDINSLKSQIEEQKILSPIYEDLSDKATFEEPRNLPFPEPQKLSKYDTNKISSIIQGIVEINGFTLKSIDTDVEGLMSESGILKLSVSMTGDFMEFRNVLIGLGSLPYLAHIEVIQINSFQEQTKIMLKIWIAQEQ